MSDERGRKDTVRGNDACTEVSDDPLDACKHDIVEEFARQLDQVCLATSSSATSLHSHGQDDNVSDLDEDDDDDDAQDGVPFGYEPLSQEDEQEDRSNETKAPSPLMVTLDSSETISADNSDLIRSVMSRIHMPEQAIPAWAKTIPESMWLPRLVDTKVCEDFNGQ